RYIVARDEQGATQGRLQIEQVEGKTTSIHPFVAPEHRRKGIATQLYRYAERAGLDVERVSTENYEHGVQTDAGKLLYEARHEIGHRALGGAFGMPMYAVGGRLSKTFSVGDPNGIHMRP